MGKNLIFTRSIKIFTCPAAQGTRKYEQKSGIFEPCPNDENVTLLIDASCYGFDICCQKSTVLNAKILVFSLLSEFMIRMLYQI